MYPRSSSILQMTLAGVLAISMSGAAAAQTTTTTTAGPASTAVAVYCYYRPNRPPHRLRSLPHPSPARCNGCPRLCSTPAPWARSPPTALSPALAWCKAITSPVTMTGQAALSNGQIFIQKADGKFQYFIQAGAYTLPSLATAFLPADKTVSNFYGPVPVAFGKVQAGKTTQFLFGSLPTLIGAEYTFTFQNMNIERGLLWNQEPAVSRGIQVNQALGKSLIRLIQLERRLLFQPLLVAQRLSVLCQGTSCPGICRRGQPQSDRLSNAGHAGAEQQQHLQRDLHVHKGILDRSAVLPVQQRPNQRRRLAL